MRTCRRRRGIVHSSRDRPGWIDVVRSRVKIVERKVREERRPGLAKFEHGRARPFVDLVESTGEDDGQFLFEDGRVV